METPATVTRAVHKYTRACACPTLSPAAGAGIKRAAGIGGRQAGGDTEGRARGAAGGSSDLLLRLAVKEFTNESISVTGGITCTTRLATSPHSTSISWLLAARRWPKRGFLSLKRCTRPTVVIKKKLLLQWSLSSNIKCDESPPHVANGDSTRVLAPICAKTPRNLASHEGKAAQNFVAPLHVRRYEAITEGPCSASDMSPRR